MKPITVSTSLPQHAPSIKSPKPLPKRPQKIESETTVKSNSLPVVFRNLVNQSNDQGDLAAPVEDAKREFIGNAAYTGSM